MVNRFTELQKCDLDLSLPFVVDTPVRSLTEYAMTGQTLKGERMLGVQGARILFANYGAILTDFEPFLGRLISDVDNDAECCRVLDRWLIENTAFVSTTQAASSLVSTPIPLDCSSRQGWRPPRYGRATVMVDRHSSHIGAGAIFDVKGTGVPPDEDPSLPNSNGLLTLNEAVHEVLMEHLVFAIMSRLGVDVRPLPSYAVLDLGFDAVWGDGRPAQRATVLIRRPATRPRCQWERAMQGPEMARTLMHIELLLRTGGISASVCGAVRFRVTAENQHRRIFRDEFELKIPAERVTAVFETTGWRDRDLIVDGVNVQITSDLCHSPLRARVMDFGRYRFSNRFDSLLYSWFDADYQSMNGAYLRPDDPFYLQPDSDFSLFHFERSEPYSSLLTCVNQYQSGKTGPAQLAKALRSAVAAAVSLLDAGPKPFVYSKAFRARSIPLISGTGWDPLG